MYLSKLDMVGFKSFGLKTELDFTDGVTAIVGPNGCGKTNVVDAIRWVLGEQKTSMLRADSMDQVIFNGSKTRKPLGMAEVSLTIENNKAILPTEYSQVVITRRLFRNGESQYLLNRTQCRLRDITDLFMDTGMGSDAYSVIELKMIETILSDKADERRHLFEEAAGVTKYKARRREAQRKLEAAQRDIARVQDIVREVQKTVNSLARQAEKAKQHQELSTKLRELDRLLFAFEYAEEYLHLMQMTERVAEIRQRREAQEQQLQSTEQHSLLAETDHQKTEADLRQALGHENDVRSALAELQQTISVLGERMHSTERALERLDREHDESQSQQSSMSEELQSLRERATQIDGQIVLTTALYEQQSQATAQVFAVLESARADVATLREVLTGARANLAERMSAADRLRIQIESLHRRRTDLEHRLRQSHDRLAEVEVQIAREGADLPQIDAQLAEAEGRLHTAEQRQIELQAKRETLQKDSEDLRSALAHSRASLEFLSGLVDTTESSKFLLNTPEWQPSGEKLTLAEIINTDPDYRVAIEAALGEAGRYFVVANRAEAQQAIAALSKNNVGKATFLCRDAIRTVAEPPSSVDINGVIGWASEVVKADDQLRSALRSILGSTLIVGSADVAWQAIALPGVQAAVTLSGEIVHAAGAVRGGSVSRTEGVRVGRRERIDQLRVSIDGLEKEIDITDSALREVKEELATIDLRRLGDEVRKMALLRNDRQQRIDAMRTRIDDVQAQQGALHNEVDAVQAELDGKSSDLAVAEDAVADARQQATDAQTQLDACASAMNTREREHADNVSQQRQVELQLVRLQGELQTLRSDEGRLTNQTMTIEQRKEQRVQEREDLQRQLAQLVEDRQARELDAATVSARLTEAKSARESLDLKVRECSARVLSLAEELRQLRKVLEGIITEQYDADVRLNEVKIRVESHVRRAQDELDIEVPVDPVPPESEQTVDEIRSNVQDLRRRLTSMGNVNFLALEEHDRENERLQFLNQQLADLTESERTLNETIAQINETARLKFTTTFEQIRQNFSTLFKMLFSEDDEADLQMVESADGDPLECTIDITAKPRGKRPHSIEMLSGGEKTLTAIALLFGIYLVKPSPFCILDEVDAPLDDANIDRYLKIIRKFAENTQFMMITHNKKTMEAADTLYGVTMEEPAVSKVVSVQLTGKSAA
ncbi:MAG: chromosome segregation protein SMC [Candidatus Kapabacteria bacterium]|nr:chromosome segregation protein SMC [Candidatus Kapabacteria bacterium]